MHEDVSEICLILDPSLLVLCQASGLDIFSCFSLDFKLTILFGATSHVYLYHETFHITRTYSIEAAAQSR